MQLQRLHEIARVPLIAKANAGIPEIVNGETVYDCPPERFTGCMEAMAQAGVSIFGGCCGTGSGHVAAMAAAAQGLKPCAPAPEHGDLLPCATEKEVFFLDPAAEHGAVLPCDEQLEDALAEVQEEAEMVAIAIQNTEELDNFADCQFMITKPLCLVCDDAGLLEEALRLYQGRALYEGSLSEEDLLPMCRKYGLII